MLGLVLPELISQLDDRLLLFDRGMVHLGCLCRQFLLQVCVLFVELNVDLLELVVFCNELEGRLFFVFISSQFLFSSCLIEFFDDFYVLFPELLIFLLKCCNILFQKIIFLFESFNFLFL